MVYLRDRGPTEIGGFGISDLEEPLLITDVVLIPQQCTSVTVKFDDAGVADYFDAQVDLGRRPEEFARLWIHTHPGTSPEPSGTDETTFARVFGSSDWAVMFILARGGATYAQLRFRAGPGGQVRIPVEVDFGHEFAASDQATWNHEYQENVRMPLPELPFGTTDPLVESRFDRRLWDEFNEREMMELDDPFLLREEIR
ncbi:MAG: hypothetical protein C0483_10475 [Pirellula sp.]|nr:hypothetical protein [Pirellula sp.]